MGERGAERDEGEGSEGRPPRAHVPAAAYAANWKTVLAVDALMGAAVIAGGLILAIVWNPIGGGFLGSLGAVYVFMVLRRAREWAGYRRDAGL